MNTQEAIEFCKDEIIYRHWNSPDITQKIFNEFEEKKQNVISLLQQGEKHEKYRLMWEEFKKCCSLSIVFDGKLQNIKDKMNWFEQKYFPKETNEYKEGNE